MTDRAMNYTLSSEFATVLADIRAVHLVTRPYRPQTNGPDQREGRALQPNDAR